MKVIYRGRESKRFNSLPPGNDDIIELLSNNWNDHGYETLFMTSCRVQGKELELGPVRLLVENEHNTRRFLNELLKNGWSGTFPIPKVEYVSTASEIAFYEQLVGAVSAAAAVRVATVLHDASYLVHLKEDGRVPDLIESEGFKKSLQRERGSVEAFLDTWRVLDHKSIAASDFTFRFEDVYGDFSTINLRFAPTKNRLPRDVNVLIGANGAGKSRLLLQIVKAWLSDARSDENVGFTSDLNLGRLVVVSYSPFERLPVDMTDTKLQDKGAYRYFGLRARKTPSSQIRLSQEIPRSDAALSLLNCIFDDQRYERVANWGEKVKTVKEVLATAIDFDQLALRVEAKIPVNAFYIEDAADPKLLFDRLASDGKVYLPIDEKNVQELLLRSIEGNLMPEAGVVFFKDGVAQRLSSGQRLFAYVVVNIVGAIRRNSLVLIDEPELFLHPSLEVQLVDMLKQILQRFNSKAILATHSPTVVREVPSDCVHVLERTNEGLAIKKPPFQTFGSDVQRISSYVFGDRHISKPFEEWIEAQLRAFEGSADELISAIGDDINEEMIIQIKAMERKQW